MTEPHAEPPGSGRAEGAVPDALAAVRADHACFGCGAENPIGLRLQFRADQSGVCAAFVPQPEHQGFEGVVHGGIISTVLDEAMAWATAAAGVWAVTGEMRVRFRRPLNLGERTSVHARVTDHQGRVIKATAELIRAPDTLVATASGTFVAVAAEVAAAWRDRYLDHDDASH